MLTPATATASVATKLAPDATVAYHAALEFWGKAYSVWHRFHYLTRSRVRGFRFRDLEFVPVQAPQAVRGRGGFKLGVTEQRGGGGVVRVTTLERTLVLDVPANAGGWEEIWRSLEMVEFFDLDAVVAYALKPSDLHRYLYATCFAKCHGFSPKLRHFPPDLLPDHVNVPLALQRPHQGGARQKLHPWFRLTYGRSWRTRFRRFGMPPISHRAEPKAGVH